ncbi:hypothetical protein THAOC_26711, partial [Thalassiosira oceanica]
VLGRVGAGAGGLPVRAVGDDPGYQTNPMGDQLQQAASHPEVFLLYEGGQVTEELRRSLTHVRVGTQVTKIPNSAFSGCGKLVEIEFNEGLQVIGAHAFDGCESLRSVTLPSTVTELACGHLSAATA